MLLKNNNNFKNKVVIITGGGSGIGKATSLLFAKEGAIVIIIDKDIKAEKTVREIKEIGGLSDFFQIDVTNSLDIKRTIKNIVERYKYIHILFNNAGIELSRSLLLTTEEEWDMVINVNLKSVFLMSKYVIPIMKKYSGGVIINNSSIAGLTGWDNASAYCASKGGVIQLTRQGAIEFAKYKIRVNCICPGSTWTPLLSRLIQGSDKNNIEKAKRREARIFPLGRLAEPEEIANAVLFLASDKASFITGAIIPIDAGYTAK